MADALRGSIDAAEYKHEVLGLIFLKHVSDAFAERRVELEALAAGFVLANGSMSAQQSGKGAIRAAIVADDLLDCIIALPGQWFRSPQIPACLWFLRRGRSAGGDGPDVRSGETLFIDANLTRLGFGPSRGKAR